MKILVFSDSHGYDQYMLDAVAAHGGAADLIVHLGDGTADLFRIREKYPQIPVVTVAGNGEEWSMPFGKRSADQFEKIIEAAEKRILITHGHRLDVKCGCERLMRYAIDREVDVVLYGHTHVKENHMMPICEYALMGQEREGYVLLFNPGSVGRRTYGCAPSYGCIEIVNGGIAASHGVCKR